jgi:ribosome-binding factor A
MSEFRTERLGTLVKQKISGLILEGKIKDPRVNSLLSITHVAVSRDLSFADVYVSNIRLDASIDRGVQGLKSASGFIQAQLGLVLKIRKIPKLRFHADTGVREGFDMIKKLEFLVDKNQETELGNV